MYFIPIQVYETVFQRVCTSVTLDLKSSVVVYKGKNANIQILAHATCFAIIKSILHLLSHFFKGGILQWCCSSMLHDTCWAFSSIRSSAKGLQVSYSKLELTKKLSERIILVFFVWKMSKTPKSKCCFTHYCHAYFCSAVIDKWADSSLKGNQ